MTVENHDPSHSSRKRGIRASRSKLERAMLSAGIKTQVALAQKIAQQENLESPPKDMVNRAFRQLPVEPISLERIAEALSISSYELYLTSDDTSHQKQQTEQEISTTATSLHTGAPSRKPWQISIVTLLLVTLGLFFYNNQSKSNSTSTVPYQPTDLTHLKLAIVDEIEHPSFGLASILKDQLSGKLKLVENWPDKSLDKTDKLEWSQALETDYVLTWETQQLERYTKLQVYLVNNQQRILLYNDALLTASISAINSILAERITDSLLSYWQTGKITVAAGLTNSPQALEQFMLAMQYLNQENTLANLSRTESRLQRALRLDSFFARAQGALCTTLLRKASLSSDVDMIGETENVCLQGLQLAALEESLQGMANYARAHDQIDEALDYYQQILTLNPRYTDALFGKFKVLQKQGGVLKQPSLFDQAKDTINLAIEQEPQSWRGYFLKSHLLYRLGKPLDAITTLEIGVSKQANFNTLNNLGTMYFCQGEMEKSKQAFLKVTKLERDPSWIIEHQLASLFQFLGETDKAIEYADSGMALMDTEQVDGHFDPWITKALAYQAHGNQQIAHQSFDKALQIAERLRVAGNDPGNTDVQLVYIKVADAFIDNQVIEEPRRQILLDELDKVANKATSPNAMVRVMLAYVMLEHFEPARPIYQQIGAMCPGFVKDPILAPLAM